MEIFKLVGSIFVDTDKANESLQKTDKNANSVGTTLANGAKGAAKFAAGLGVAAAGAVTAMVSVATSTAETLDAVDKASQRMDISAESYQELAHAAELSGVEMSTLEKAAKKLEGTDMNMDDALDQIYALGTAEERSAKAAELFGESVAYSMGPMLNASAEDMAAMRQEANDLGLVMSGDTVKAGAELNDAITKVKESVSALGTNVGAALMPIIKQGCDMIIEFMPTIRQVIDDIAPVLIETLNVLAPILFDLVQQLLPPLLELVKALLPLFSTLCELILPPLIQLLKFIIGLVVDYVIPAITKVVNVVQKIIKNAPAQFAKFKNTIVSVFEAISNGVKKPINAVIEMINKMIDALNALSFDVPDWVPVMGGKKFGFNLKNIPLLADGGTVQMGGSAIVGEAGAELIDMPAGARVTPLQNKDIDVVDYDKMASAFLKALTEAAPMLQSNVEISADSKGIFKAVRDNARIYQKSTGREAFSF